MPKSRRQKLQSLCVLRIPRAFFDQASVRLQQSPAQDTFDCIKDLHHSAFTDHDSASALAELVRAHLLQNPEEPETVNKSNVRDLIKTVAGDCPPGTDLSSAQPWARDLL